LEESHPGLVADVRGRGLMCAVEFTAPVAPIVADLALASGVVLNAIGTHILRFLPPLVCTSAEVDKLMRVLGEAVSDPAVIAEVEAAAEAADGDPSTTSDDRSA
jgi:acetylornithine/succinyldiaminopimelate/putrescine aminotransferase